MKHALTIAAVLMLTPATGVVAQGHNLWVGSHDVDPGRIAAGTQVLNSAMTRNGESQPGVKETEEIAFVSWDDKHYLRQTVVVERDGQVMTTDTTYYNTETLAPVRHASHAPRWRTLSLSYWGNKVAGTNTPADGEAKDFEVTLDHQVYDPSGFLLLLRSLPLEADYGVKVPIFDHEKLEASSMDVWVNGTEWVKTGADQYEDAFVVSVSYEANDGTAKYWIAKDTRLLLKTESSWAGRSMTGWARFIPANAETDTPEGGR